MDNNKKAPPTKRIVWGQFEITEWENNFIYEGRECFSKRYTISCKSYNKETKKSETESSIQIDNISDISILRHLVSKAFNGKIEDTARLGNYIMDCDRKEGVFKLSKEYKDKDNITKYSTLIIRYETYFIKLLDLLNRSMALFITPAKIQKSQNLATNIVPTTDETNKFIGELEEDDDIPF